MTAPVVALKPRVEANVVETLRDLLARAERGEIVAVAIASQLAGSQEAGCAYALGEKGSTAYLLGAIETVKLRILGVIL